MKSWFAINLEKKKKRRRRRKKKKKKYVMSLPTHLVLVAAYCLADKDAGFYYPCAFFLRKAKIFCNHD